ncbi:13711_t:CDS:2, partial [Entrophospora sp. SA101]
TIQNFSSKIVHSTYLMCSLEALQINFNLLIKEILQEFVIIDVAEDGITFSVSSIYNTQATVLWNSKIFESYDYNNNVSGRIQLKVHFDSLISILKTFDITLLHESVRKESRLTTSLINDENNKFNLLNDQYVRQNTLYEIKIK